LAAAIVTEIRTLRALKSIVDLTWVLYGLLLVSVVLGALIWPDHGMARGVGVLGVQLRGVVPSIATNGVGDVGAVLFVIAFTRLLLGLRGRAFYWSVLVAGFVMAIMAQSRSPIAAAVMAIVVILLCSRRVIPAVAILMSAALISWYLSDTFTEYIRRGQNPELFMSLSGRTKWWTVGLDYIEQRPLLGFGAYAGSRFLVLAPTGFQITSSIHNAWLEIFVSNGLIGLIPVVLAFITICLVYLKWLLRGTSDRVELCLLLETAGILTIEAGRSIFSSGLVMHPSTLFFVVVIFAEVYRRKWQERAGLRGLPEPSRNPRPRLTKVLG
jgi:O-antigen ligase